MTVYRPEHVNEFHDAKGKEWDLPLGYRGTVCWAAVGCGLLDAGSRGDLTATVPAFRNASGNKRRQGNLEDISNGLVALGLKVPMRRFYGLPRSKAREMLNAQSRRFTALEVDNEIMPRTCSPSFDGNHLVLVYPGGTMGNVMLSDPTCDKAHQVDLDKLLDAACLYARQQGEPKATVNMGYVAQPREPAPDPVDPRDAIIDALQDELAAALSALAKVAATASPFVPA